ncbi:hypothetical protein HID58_042341 [Brassica napus]|uniref:Replication protein A 70 kDa DNA-binding subunit B/D first OB fold domain-containing protein n=1 Tax=Brassica napus TaxID=3708 RepID=A0ABQ8BDQ0_BRANA|nr:hypothetical protein HID58_042341 [Brassica napus]
MEITHMAMVTSDTITLLNDVKPYKPTWKVEVKVLHSWILFLAAIRPFIITNKTGVQIIHCTCKRLFLARVQKLQVGQWRFIENFALTAAAGKYQPTSHKCYWLSYKYWGYPGCVCASYHQLARCLWNRFAEQMLYAYKVGQVYKGMLSTNRLDKFRLQMLLIFPQLK